MNQTQNKQVEQNLNNDSEIFDDNASEIDESELKTKRNSRLSVRTTASEYSASYQEIHPLFGNKLEVNDLKKLQASNENPNEPDKLQVKELINKKNGKKVVPIQAEAFFNFERMLFDLVGLKKEQSIDNNTEVPQTNIPQEQMLRDQDIKKINEFLKNPSDVAFINDMYLLNEVCDINLAESEIINKSDERKDKQAKLITVILNHAIRPRKALRMVINRKNQINLDNLMNDLSLNFKMDYSFIKKLFNLGGKEVKNKSFISMNIYTYYVDFFQN